MLTYREEIDGLRAIAVISVILFHADFHLLCGGGYVGVDIFFVISGYLITAIIEKEIQNGHFTIKKFYERRCRRILPMVFTMMFVGSMIGYRCLSSAQLNEMGLTFLSVVTFSANFLFWSKDDSYFNPVSQTNPFVHTWSLAVEEQFYFFYPILYRSLRHNPRILAMTLTLIAIISFILGQWGGNINNIGSGLFYMFAQHPFATFYLPFGRLWELLLGAAATLIVNQRALYKFSRKIDNCLAFLGLFMIFSSIYALNEANIPPFPNLFTLFPTMGAFFIISFATKETCVGHILSIRNLRHIGLISYSLYLWHQPILTFFRTCPIREISSWSMIFLMIGLILLSSASYSLIEKPFRNRNFLTSIQVFLLSFLGTVAIMLMSSIIIYRESYQASNYLKSMEGYSRGKLRTLYGRDLCNGLWDDRPICREFSNSSLKKLLIVGDSFGGDTLDIVEQGVHMKNYEIRGHYILSSCQIYVGNVSRLNFIEARYHSDCRKGNDILDAISLIKRADVIFLASFWVKWSATNLPRTLKLLNITEKQKVFIFGAKQLYPCRKQFDTESFNEYLSKRTFQFPALVNEVNDILQKNFDSSTFIDLHKHLCEGFNKTCSVFTSDGIPIFRDCTHLSKLGARHLGNILFKQKPLNKL